MIYICSKFFGVEDRLESPRWKNLNKETCPRFNNLVVIASSDSGHPNGNFLKEAC